jgi:predicted  nucleic acid-binding Zn-ribbon protein
VSTPDGNEAIIEEFLGDEPRAEMWRNLRQALQDRLRDAVAARDEIPEGHPRRAEVEARIEELRDQVAALAQEEAITQFVEDSVRASLNRPARPGGFADEFDDEGY